MPRPTLHVVSHTHWDREWYLPLEPQRRRLVKLLDDVLDVIDADPEFHSFHLDGQTIPIEDYLAIRPSQRDRFAAAAAAGKIAVGPHYILQDEFLTSAEAQVRNLLYGLQDARAYAAPLMVGYLADAFGHIGQMPAILAGFGLDNAVFGRGLNHHNPGAVSPEERGYHSEVIWRGSDGTEILGLWMANWYANAMDLPREPEALRERLQAIRANCERWATVPHLLLMNGCDHTPCQLDISRILAVARELMPEADIVHARLDEFVAAAREAVGELEVVAGEMRSRYTAGWHVLTNVLSSRLYLKQANWRCQTLLERCVEPLQAVGGVLFAPRESPVPMRESTAGDRDFRRYLWKRLLACHPHDNICGCSCDAVHADMEVRFAQVEQLAEQLTDELLDAVAARVETSWLAADERAILVYNPHGSAQTALVETLVDFPEGTELGSVRLRDAEGHPVACWIEEDLGSAWDYELPDDRFRVAYDRRRVRLAFEATVPGLGYAVYAAAASPEPEAEEVDCGETLENEHLAVYVHTGGVLDIHDKAADRWWHQVNVLWYGRDCGNEYDYRVPPDDVTYALSDREDDFCEHDGWAVDRGVYQEYHGLITVQSPELAEPAEEELEGEPGELEIEYRIRLPRSSRRIEVFTLIANHGCENFRLRAHFPTHATAATADADGQFEVVARPIEPWQGWRNPSDCHPCQAFVEVGDAGGGLTIANRGLPEYEVLRDGDNTIAVTLLRAVGEIGDWGKFATPDAQCVRANVADYAILPHRGDDERASHADARAWNAPLRARQTDRHAGTLPPVASWLTVDPPEVQLSAVRWAEDRDALMVRLYNPYPEPAAVRLQVGLPLSRAWRCRLDETREAEVGSFAGALTTQMTGKSIVTLEFQ